MIKHTKNYAKVGKKEQNKDKNNNNNKIAYQQGIQDHSTGPNICSRPVVTFPSYHLEVVQLNLFFCQKLILIDSCFTSGQAQCGEPQLVSSMLEEEEFIDGLFQGVEIFCKIFFGFMPFNHKYTSKDVLHTLCMEYFGVWKYSVKCFLFGNRVLGWRMSFCGWTSIIHKYPQKKRKLRLSLLTIKQRKFQYR